MERSKSKKGAEKFNRFNRFKIKFNRSSIDGEGSNGRNLASFLIYSMAYCNRVKFRVSLVFNYLDPIANLVSFH